MVLKTTARILSDDEISELDLSVDKDKLIESFIGIASNIARSYKRLPEIDLDDLQSEAILAVVIAVDKLSKMNHPNPGGYINKYIHR